MKINYTFLLCHYRRIIISCIIIGASFCLESLHFKLYYSNCPSTFFLLPPIEIFNNHQALKSAIITVYFLFQILIKMLLSI